MRVYIYIYNIHIYYIYTHPYAEKLSVVQNSVIISCWPWGFHRPGRASRRLRWSKKGPLSLKPLSAWYLDILERVRRVTLLGNLFEKLGKATIKQENHGIHSMYNSMSIAGKIILKWDHFQQTMFEYRRVGKLMTWQSLQCYQLHCWESLN